MKIFRYFILILLLFNMPGFMLYVYGDGAGSLFSYLTIVALTGYYFINKKHAPPWPFVIFAVLYFLISGLVYIPDQKFYLTDFLKYVIVIVASAELAQRTSAKEIFIFMLLSASSILINVLAFPMDYGRYSGFFLDPNSAGFACSIGVALSFAIKNDKLKNIGLAFLTFCGALTFSRTFFVVWFILILISVFQNRKNSKLFIGGFAGIIILLSVSSSLQLNTERLNILDNLFEQGSLDKSAEEGSRTGTWAKYYDLIYDKPLFGNGYKAFKSDNIYDVGVHNNYLRVIGDSGIIPFVIFLGIYLFLIFKSLRTFKSRPHEFLLAVSLFFLGLTNHNFDSIHHVTFVSIWLYLKVLEQDNEELDTDYLGSGTPSS